MTMMMAAILPKKMSCYRGATLTLLLAASMLLLLMMECNCSSAVFINSNTVAFWSSNRRLRARRSHLGQYDNHKEAQQQLSSTITEHQRLSLDSSSNNAVSAICDYHQVTIPTSQEGPPRQAISIEDLTPTICNLLDDSGMTNGVINVISRHTTTAITINERESRLAQDVQEYLLKLAPPDERSSCSSDAAAAASNNNEGVRYYHNDIDQRPDGPEEAQRCRDNGWDIDDPIQLQRWRDQEPINAHSHILAMLLGSSECIPVVNGTMVIGQWQSVLLVDLDGPRDRTVGIQFLGYQ